MSAGARARAWALLGEPAEQLGSLRDPRLRVANDGLYWNESWVYRTSDGPRRGRITRVLLWNRGRMVALLRIGDDGLFY